MLYSFCSRLRQPLFHGPNGRQLADVAPPRYVQGVSHESISELRPDEGTGGSVNDGGHPERVPRPLLHGMSGESALHQQGGRAALSGGMSAVRGVRQRRWRRRQVQFPGRLRLVQRGGSGGGSCLILPRPAGCPGCRLPDAVRVLVDRQRRRLLWQAVWHLRRPVPAPTHAHGLRAGCCAECGGSRRHSAQPSAVPAHLPHPAAESPVCGPLPSVREAVDAAALSGAAGDAGDVGTAPASGAGPVLCTVLVIWAPDGVVASVVERRGGLRIRIRVRPAEEVGFQSNPSSPFLLSRRIGARFWCIWP